MKANYTAIANALATARVQCCDFDSGTGRANALQAHDHVLRELVDLFSSDLRFSVLRFAQTAGADREMIEHLTRRK